MRADCGFNGIIYVESQELHQRISPSVVGEVALTCVLYITDTIFGQIAGGQEDGGAVSLRSGNWLQGGQLIVSASGFFECSLNQGNGGAIFAQIFMFNLQRSCFSLCWVDATARGHALAFDYTFERTGGEFVFQDTALLSQGEDIGGNFKLGSSSIYVSPIYDGGGQLPFQTCNFTTTDGGTEGASVFDLVPGGTLLASAGLFTLCHFEDGSGASVVRGFGLEFRQCNFIANHVSSAVIIAVINGFPLTQRVFNNNTGL
jgi:hypothetical protein